MRRSEGPARIIVSADTCLPGCVTKSLELLAGVPVLSLARKELAAGRTLREGDCLFDCTSLAELLAGPAVCREQRLLWHSISRQAREAGIAGVVLHCYPRPWSRSGLPGLRARSRLVAELRQEGVCLELVCSGLLEEDLARVEPGREGGPSRLGRACREYKGPHSLPELLELMWSRVLGDTPQQPVPRLEPHSRHCLRQDGSYMLPLFGRLSRVLHACCAHLLRWSLYRMLVFRKE